MNWIKELDRSSSEASIVALAQDYLADIPQWLRCFIPRECNRQPIARAGDVLAWSAALAQRFAGEEIARHDVQVQELVVFFIKAASKLADLRDRDRYAANFERYRRPERVLDGSESG